MYSEKVNGVSCHTGRIVVNDYKTCALIDGNNFGIRAYFSQRRSGEEVSPAKFLGNCLRILINLIERHKFDFVIFTFDGGKEWRSNLIASNKENWFRETSKKGYKGNRALHEANDYEIVKHYIKVLRTRILSVLGIPCFVEDKIEADDLIHWISKYLIRVNKVIISADEDLVQCCKHPNTYWYSPGKKIWLSKHNFEEHNGYPFEHYVKFKSICGDGSDNIEGIDKVAMKTLWNWRVKSGEHPADFFENVSKYGTDGEKKKYLTQRHMKNLQVSEFAIDLDVFASVWGGLSLQTFYQTLVSCPKPKKAEVYKTIINSGISSVAPSKLLEFHELLLRCSKNIETLNKEGIWTS